MINWIDVKFNFYSDTPSGKDPDSYSPTLRRYHQILWSKPLTSGIIFKLDKNTRKVLHHESQIGEFFLSSDSIAHTYRYKNSMNHIINDISLEEIESFYSLCSTIGGYIIFPSKKIDNKMTINIARGINSKIRDRFDLTLECIRRYYINKQSPLDETLKRYSSFFELFDNFKGYVDFFLLNDLVNEKYSSIKYFIPFESFEKSPLPRDVQEYKLYKKNMTNFLVLRNQRIHNNYNQFPPSRKSFNCEEEYCLAYKKWSRGVEVPRCPQCNSSKVIYYLYGYPGEPPEILEKELGYYRVELMGCIPPMGEGKEMFDHECNDCKYKWWIEDTDEDDEYL